MAESSSPQDMESSTTSQISGLDLSSLDAKMQEIEDSLQEMDLKDSSATPTPGHNAGEEGEEEEDSDSEDEGGKCN